MGRGSGQAQSLLNSEEGAANTAQQQSGQIFGTEFPAIKKMIQSPGYDPATQAAIIGTGTTAANAPFGSAMDQASRTAARTNNMAGLDSSLDSMARQKAIADANAGQKAQIAIAQDKQQQEQEGIGDSQNLFGTTSRTMSDMYGNSNNAMKNYLDTQKSGIMGLIGSLAGAGATAYAGR